MLVYDTSISGRTPNIPRLVARMEIHMAGKCFLKSGDTGGIMGKDVLHKLS